MKISSYSRLAILACVLANAPAHAALYYFDSLTTVKGRSYQKVEIHEITPSGIRISHDAGTATIPFEALPKDLQARLGSSTSKTAAAATKKQPQAASPSEPKRNEESKTSPSKAEAAPAGKAAPATQSVDLPDQDTPPPPTRFSTEVLSFLQAISSQYYCGGVAVKGLADPKPTLTRLATTQDPSLKEAVRVALNLDANQKAQEAQGRFLDAKMNGMVPDVQGETLAQGAEAAAAPRYISGYHPVTNEPIYSQENLPLSRVAQGLEASMDGANTQAALNRMSELNIQSLALGSELREKVNALAQRDLPKAETLPSPIVAKFVKPGMLAVTNRSGKTLHHCLFSTATTMLPPRDESGHQAIANVLNTFVGFSPEFCRESAQQTALRAKLAGAPRGFTAYAPLIRDQETIIIPFCDMPSLPAAGEVRLSLWTDEFTGEDAPVAGLQALKSELEAEARARWEREQANAGRRSGSPLQNGQRPNLSPKIARDPSNPLHQGNGARMFNR